MKFSHFYDPANLKLFSDNKLKLVILRLCIEITDQDSEELKSLRSLLQEVVRRWPCGE